MANLLLTNKLADDIKDYIIGIAGELRDDGKPTGLAIVRVGKNPSDIAYEKSIEKYAETVGINTYFYRVDEDIHEDEFLELIEEINDDEAVDGVLIFKPLPQQIDGDMLKEAVMPLKDIDGVSGSSMALLYDTPVETDEEIMPSWLGSGFPPCTAEACILILDSYGIDPTGKKAVVIGRSDVIGKPVSLMLLNRDATVTICHTKTKNLEDIAKEADILIVATGRKKSIGKDYVSPGQTVIDVGIHVDEDGSMCGDVDFDQVEPIVENITPVPGGVGGLTTALLLKHAVDASLRFFIIENEIEFEDEEYMTGEPIENSDMEIRGKVIKFNLPEDDK